jgi:hypothetical protein
LRLVGAGMTGTGHAIRSVGNGMANFGTKIKMGRGKEWVYEADVRYDGEGKDVRKSDLKKSAVKKSNTKHNTTSTKTCAGAKSSTGGGNWPESQQKWREMIGDGTKREIKVFDKKGRPIWGDEDSDADTEKGSLVDEKL